MRRLLLDLKYGTLSDLYLVPIQTSRTGMKIKLYDFTLIVLYTSLGDRAAIRCASVLLEQQDTVILIIGL